MRDIDLLLPEVKQRALQLKALAKERLGLNIIFTNTLRTNAEQQALYAQGRQSLANVNGLRALANMAPISDRENKSIVTKASNVSNSFHGYGMAFDIAVTDSSGKKIDWTNKSDWNANDLDDWTEIGHLAEECGLEWGGNWSGMVDPPHFQYRYGLTLAELKAGKRPHNA